MNIISITGRLGKDPEVKEFPSGGFVCNFSIADNYSEKGKDGKYENKSRWHNCKAWNSNFIKGYCKKGDTLAITGELTYEEWESNGEKKSRPVIVVRQSEKVASATPKDAQQPQQPAQAAPQPVSDDNLPF